MINHLVAAHADRSLPRKFQYYRAHDFLVRDELGYLPLGPYGSNLFFQVLNQRHQQRSTILAINHKPSQGTASALLAGT